ncbi:NAD-dependent epimerase/dehydratase family protein [Polynucleobacter sp. AP-Feld-500C-C5]|uniref:NAD-dependent epimerase/dehydratase family protein n=1 Tax=Polynucleobacter sp. AP-Feld-500C-C5 TaxID=2576924 RepID=UPI001C0C87AF|nr:NAD-dependent epimerase/dehydratase family protein [Polynucleobacter sp. AP-Feld-500C-C5]MBU3632865.1 GDP-mannose 4,6-dehydratase [Polynucleobacter sp. AP-Feld-500C-C5]
MSNKPVALVTGGAGFIGSHMVDLLIEKGYSVRVIDNLIGGRMDNLAHHMDNPDFAVEERDIREYESNDSFFNNVKYVFHFAGIGDIVPSIENPIEYMSTNVQGTVRMLECARFAGVAKFVYASSSSCYGLATTPTSEDHKIDTRYPYALSKYQGEQAAFHWHQVYQVPVNAIRIFNAYGTRSRTSGAYGAVFGVFLKQKIAGKPYTVVGDGSQMRDFLYVTDVAKAFLAAAETKYVGRFYNLGAGKPQSVNSLVELLGGEVIFIPKRPGEPDCTWANIGRITSDLKWKPEISFEEGVKTILSNIDYWKNAPLWEPSSIEKATKTWFKYLN